MESPKISRSNSFQANSVQTKSATTISFDKGLVAKEPQKEDAFKGVKIETKPAEEINGIKIYQTQTANDLSLSHLDKKNPDRLKFKQNVEEMNKMLQEVKSNIGEVIREVKDPKVILIFKNIQKLPRISDSSYMPDTTAFEFCEYMKILKTQFKHFENFNVEELQNKVNFNEDYKARRMDAKREIIRRNEERFGDKYTDLKYEEKAENPSSLKDEGGYESSSYSFSDNGFYSKERDVNGVKKKFLRRRYSSGEEQLKQFDEGQERVRQAKTSFSKLKYAINVSEYLKKCSELGKKWSEVKYTEKEEDYRKSVISCLKQIRSDGCCEIDDLNESDMTSKDVLRLLVNVIRQLSQQQNALNAEYNSGANEDKRADMVTDKGKRNNGSGVERKDMILHNVEFRGKDEDGKAVINVPERGNAKLNIGVKTLTQLFPYDDERTMSPIQQTGDCYLVNVFTQFMKDPEKRVDIYKCFTTSDDGKTLTVKYPGGNISLTYELNEKGEIEGFEQSKNALDGSLGFKILEELQACERVLSSCETEQPKQDVINILQQTDRNIDDRLKDICDKGIKRGDQAKSEDQSAFSYFIDGGKVQDIENLMNYYSDNRDEILLEDVTSTKDSENYMGRLFTNHAQAIVDTSHYGVMVEEPNTSNKQGFVSFDNIVTGSDSDLYTEQLMRTFGKNRLNELREKDIYDIYKELKSKGLEGYIKSLTKKEQDDRNMETLLATVDSIPEDQMAKKPAEILNAKSNETLLIESLEYEYQKEEYAKKLELKEIGKEEYLKEIAEIEKKEKECLGRFEEIGEIELSDIEIQMAFKMLPEIEFFGALAGMELSIYGNNYKRKGDSNFK